MKSGFRVAHRPRLYLSSRGKLMIYAVFGATWGSGLLWIIFHYFFLHRGEFGDEIHPLEHPLLVVHGACAFMALWLGGWLWSAHVLPWWSTRKRRSSGVVLILFGAILIATGYLLYYASGDGLRRWTGILHWSLGLALAIPLLVHALRSGRYRRGE
jgi:hypothetical protein